MIKDDKDIVSVVRRALAERIGQDRFELWFSTAVDFAVDASTLRVLAAHAFSLERLRKFRDDLEAVARGVLGPAAAVRFCVDEACQPRRVAAPALVESKSAGSLHPRQTAFPFAAPPQLPIPATIAPPAAARTTKRPLETLGSFVIGDTNRLAHAAASTVERRLGQASPLFIHGPTGCGKSHLLEGISVAVRKAVRERRVVLLSAEQFTANFIEALQGGAGLPMFRRKYRDVDVLLIDDVQFFAGKKATLIEVQHTIDTLSRAGKQIVLAADRPPAELGHLGSELVARMSGGLAVGIEAADETTRYQVLHQLAVKHPTPIPDDVLRWLASQLPGDARQLKGALHRITAASEAFGKAVTLELAVGSTRDLLASARKAVQLVDIERAVCNIFGVTSDALHAEKRTKKLSLPRALAMWLARKHTRSALVEIGEYFGRRSHSTVIAAHNNVEKWRNVGETISLTGGACAIDDAIKRVEAELRVG